MTTAYIPDALRRLVYERAQGRCEYCLTPESVVLSAHQVDHIIAQKHGGLTQAENLALACALCNKYKGSDLASLDPDTGEIAPLYHPRRDRWAEHFRLVNGRVVPLTPAGRVTVRLLQFNHPDRISERLLLIKAGLIRVPDQS
jgi:hypothetical protein